MQIRASQGRLAIANRIVRLAGKSMKMAEFVSALKTDRLHRLTRVARKVVADNLSVTHIFNKIFDKLPLTTL